VAVPVVVDGAVWGAMSVGSRGPEPPPRDLEGRLSKFTELLATAVANAESRAVLAASEARARKLASEQAALRRVATLVAENASAEELFGAVAREVAELFEIEMVNIDRFENGESVVLASLDVPGFPVGSRWPLDGTGARTLVYQTGRSARVDDSPGTTGTAPAA